MFGVALAVNVDKARAEIRIRIIFLIAYEFCRANVFHFSFV